MLIINRKNSCRLCGGGSLSRVYSMPACPPVDAFRYANRQSETLEYLPMDLYRCEECLHIQLIDVVDPNILFGSYIYLSSSSPDLDRHFSEYAKTLFLRYPDLTESGVMVDVGCNDGLLLDKIANFGAIRPMGVDASRFCCDVAQSKGHEVINGFFSGEVSTSIIDRYGRVNVVTANNVFSHADNLRELAEAIFDLLSPSGLFVFEVSYWFDTIKNKVLDYVYHEHLSYHSVIPLKRFLESTGFTIESIQRVNTKGGSIRVFCRKSVFVKLDAVQKALVEDFCQEEMAAKIYSNDIFAATADYFEAQKYAVHDIVSAASREGRVIFGYGASATGSVLTRLLDLDNRLSFIVDDNSLRQGRLTPVGKVPVCGISALNQQERYVCIVLAWRFWDEILPKLEMANVDVVCVRPLNDSKLELVHYTPVSGAAPC